MVELLEPYKDVLDEIVNLYINPIISGKVKVYPYWQSARFQKVDGKLSRLPVPTPVFDGLSAEERCSEDALRKLLPNVTPMIGNARTDSCYYFSEQICKMLVELENRKDKSVEWLCKESFMSSLLERFNKLRDLPQVTESDQYSFSCLPHIYKEYNGLNGYMGWHTNHISGSEFRWYFVYNTDEDSSVWGVYDQENDKVIYKKEPKGWSLNIMNVPQGLLDGKTGLRVDGKYYFHCLYTKTLRFSLGIRNLTIPEIDFKEKMDQGLSYEQAQKELQSSMEEKMLGSGFAT